MTDTVDPRDVELTQLRAQLAAVQADNAALRGALEQVHGLNVAWNCDLSQHCADPLTVLDNMLAITEPIVCTDVAPGAPLVEEATQARHELSILRDDDDPLLVRLAAALAAVRAVLGEGK